jgi:hypothetical protein
MGGGFIESQIEGIIEPSIWIRYAPGLGYQTLGANIPLSTDLNLRYHSYGRRDEMTFWTGGGVSTSKYFHVEAGMHLPLGALLNDPSDKVSMGITLSFPFAQNGLNLGNSAELTIAYAMD